MHIQSNWSFSRDIHQELEKIYWTLKDAVVSSLQLQGRSPRAHWASAELPATSERGQRKKGVCRVWSATPLFIQLIPSYYTIPSNDSFCIGD